MFRSLTAVLVALGVSLGLVVASVATPAGAATVGPFRGLGTWVDAFDYAPAFQDHAGTPPVTPESVADMAALGVRTLYLQAAMNDDRAPGKIVDDALVGDFLTRAHRAGVAVVAWYYPTLTDPAVDVEHIRALADFRVRGQRFDGIALDIEATQGLPDVDARDRAVVDLAKQTRRLVGTMPIAAAVYPPVQLEVLNQSLWPKFPYKRLAKYVDVWMPMTYWSFRTGDYRDPYAYTTESVARLRKDLGDKRALVHPIGGIADTTTADDYRAFARAVHDTKAVGWSVYDYNTTLSSAWPDLRALGAPTTTTTAPTPTTASPTTAKP